MQLIVFNLQSKDTMIDFAPLQCAWLFSPKVALKF